MPPMPQVYLYATASRLILAGCRCRKTFDNTPSARLRGVSSCLTRSTDFQRSVFSGCCRALSSSTARPRTTLPPSSRASTRLLPFLPLPPLEPAGVPGGAGVIFFPSVSAMIHPLHITQDGALVAELGGLAFGPPVDAAQVHDDLAFRIELHVGTVHGPRRGAFEVDAFGIVATAMARALEFVFAGLPVRRAAEVGAD